MKEYKRVEYMCTYCGRKSARPSNMGRPHQEHNQRVKRRKTERSGRIDGLSIEITSYSKIKE